MQNIDVQLKECTYYLIQLFYKTGKKYSCTQTKLGKMLSILAFKYAKRNETLFVSPIYRYAPRCGTLIRALTFVPKDVYLRDVDQGNPDNCKYITEKFDESVIIDSSYDEVKNLSEKTKRDLEDLFRNFGAYSASVLGDLLNPIVDEVINAESEIINLRRFSNLCKEQIKLQQADNDVVNYICQD